MTRYRHARYIELVKNDNHRWYLDSKYELRCSLNGKDWNCIPLTKHELRKLYKIITKTLKDEKAKVNI